MESVSKFNKGLFDIGWNLIKGCVISIFSKYTWFVPLKDKKSYYKYQQILDESNHKPNKIWVDKGSEFYDRSMKSRLQDINIEMYSPHNEGKSVVAGRFIRTLKNKIYKYMNLISKNVYIDKLDDIVNKHNNTYHSTIKEYKNIKT